MLQLVKGGIVEIIMFRVSNIFTTLRWDIGIVIAELLQWIRPVCKTVRKIPRRY
jgi:hypothetical protein